MQNQQLLDLQEQLKTVRSELDALKGEFYKNNFSSSQNFNKDCTFNSRLRVPVYSSAPAICEVGDLIAIAGKLYICTVANTTFTVVGTQS